MRSAIAALLVTATAGCQKAPAALPEDPDFVIAREVIAEAMRDPGSVTFGPLSHGKPGFICGTVDTANGYGGRTGPRAFAYGAFQQDRLLKYDYDSGSASEWDTKVRIADEFAKRGCSIGPDNAAAIASIRV